MTEKSKIEQAVKYQMDHYPRSTLRDLYKNFFQDFYGPGHLLENPERAIAYLEREMKAVEDCSLNRPVEEIGYMGNFVRVDLCLVSKGKVEMKKYTELFVESADSFQVPDIQNWREEWGKIISVIENMNYSIEGFEKDRKMIDSMLMKGEYVMHHSRIYLQEYDPHYRIFRKELVEDWLKFN